MKRFIKQFIQKSKDSKLIENKNLSSLTTFKIKSIARVYIEVASFSDLMLMQRLAKFFSIKCFCLGGGSKVLLPPKINGVVYTLTKKFSCIEMYNNVLIVGAGTKMSDLCAFTAKNNLSCVEWGLGVPCKIGGGVYMNAGCFGKSFSDVVLKVIYTDGEKIYTRENKDCEFGYRKSFFQGKNLTILYVILKYSKMPNIRKTMIEMYTKKVSSQVYNYGSVGSVFKASVIPTPLFIEACNLKCYKVGGAEVSKKHCGFIINKKNCTQRQVLKIIYKIKKTVWKKYAILLHNEVICLGGNNGIFRRLSYTHNI